MSKNSNMLFKINHKQKSKQIAKHTIHSSPICESPFGSPSSTFSLYLEPVLNSYYQSYQNIITLDREPSGPIRHLVSKISMPQLSPFQSASAYANPFYNGMNCVWVLLRYNAEMLGGVGSGAFKNADSFMGVDDIPAVFSYFI